jgi:hypothetical protein
VQRDEQLSSDELLAYMIHLQWLRMLPDCLTRPLLTVCSPRHLSVNQLTCQGNNPTLHNSVTVSLTDIEHSAYAVPSMFYEHRLHQFAG